MNPALWHKSWPPLEVARAGDGGALRRLWLCQETGKMQHEGLEFWVDPSMVVAVGVADRVTLTSYGAPELTGPEVLEFSTVYIGRTNPAQVVVLGSPWHVFKLLELPTS